MTIDTSIFKAYDIRGIYPKELNEEAAYRISCAYAKIIKDENPGKILNIVVGNDMRTSSPSLKERVVAGLAESGINIIDVGLVTTPTFYFSVAYYGYDGGLQVSASHNPKEYNGFKMTRKNAIPVSGETGINEIKDAVVNFNFPESKVKGETIIKEGVTKEMVDVQIKEKNINLNKIKPFKIVVDAANAMGMIDVDLIFEKLPCELVKLNWKLDGNFPAHQPDPLHEENLIPTKEKVIESGADLGIVPDGDGDRYFFIDEKGEVVRQEILRGIMAQLELNSNPGAVVAYDIRPGKITKDLILEAGGKPIVTRVGHSLIKEQMIKEGAIFGGESSGHYFYKFDYGTFEAPVVLILKFLEYISEKNIPLSQIIAPYKKYHHSGEINSQVKDKTAKMKELEEKYSNAKEISHLDGVSIDYDDYWFNVRPSNTENLLRLNLEAVSKEIMEQKKDEVLALIRS
jgi:phosphomannomutase